MRSMRLAVAVLAAFSFPAPHAALGGDEVRAAALRYIDSGGTDARALQIIERAGDAALPVVRAIAAEGRKYAPAPKGIIEGFAKLTLDPGFEVKYSLYVPDAYDPAVPCPLLLYVHGTHSSGGEALKSVLPGFRDDVRYREADRDGGERKERIQGSREAICAVHAQIHGRNLRLVGCLRKRNKSKG